MKTRLIPYGLRLNIRTACIQLLLPILINALALAAAYGHDSTVVHPALTIDSFESANNSFYTQENRNDLRQGSIDEDDKLRFLAHGYDPITGSGWFWGSGNAKAAAIDLWNQVFIEARMGNVAGVNGEFYKLGRILHLLEDMTSPAHVHSIAHPTGDDFETWGVGNVGAYLLSSQLAKMPANVSLEGFIDKISGITYAASSFQGQLIEVAGSQPDSELKRMFPSLHYVDGGLLGDNYWEIDVVGTYDKFLTYNGWWPCDDDYTTDNNGPDGKQRIIGNFYIKNAKVARPVVYKGAPSTKSLVEIYGDCLYPECVSYCAGFLQYFASLPIDVIFCIDTTGSMWDDIDAVKVSASDIVNELFMNIPNVRVAVTDYRDFPIPYYGAPGDYPFHDVTPFTTSADSAIAGIQSLQLGDGWDWEESVYSALMHAIDSTSLGGWRGNGIRKMIIVMCDAPPHDPEPFTGYTLASVIQAAEDADPVALFPVVIGGDWTTESYGGALAEGSGGKLITAPDAEAVVESILDTIHFIQLSPICEAGGPYSGYVGTEITLDASGSYDPDGLLALYEWDLDSDGTYDFATSTPKTDALWDSEFLGAIRLRVTDNTGLSSIDTAQVLVTSVRDVKSQLNIVRSGYRYNRATKQFMQSVTIQNTSGSPIEGPISFVLDNLPANITLTGSSGMTSRLSPIGSPFVQINCGADNILTIGESISINLGFDNPLNVGIHYNVRILAGPGTR